MNRYGGGCGNFGGLGKGYAEYERRNCRMPSRKKAETRTNRNQRQED